MSRKNAKTRRSVVTEKYQKCLGQQLLKNVKNSHFFPKTRKSTITENAKNSHVRGHRKCQKLAHLRSWKNTRILQLRCDGKITHQSTVTKNTKMFRSAIMQKCQKLALFAKYSLVRGQGKMPKSHKSLVTKNAKNS